MTHPPWSFKCQIHLCSQIDRFHHLKNFTKHPLSFFLKVTTFYIVIYLTNSTTLISLYYQSELHVELFPPQILRKTFIKLVFGPNSLCISLLNPSFTNAELMSIFKVFVLEVDKYGTVSNIYLSSVSGIYHFNESFYEVCEYRSVFHISSEVHK